MAAVARAIQLLRRIRLGMVLNTLQLLRRIRRPMAHHIHPGMVHRTPPLRRRNPPMELTRPAAAAAHAPRVVLPIRPSRPTLRLPTHRPQGRAHPQRPPIPQSHIQSPAALMHQRRPCEPRSTLHTTIRTAR